MFKNALAMHIPLFLFFFSQHPSYTFPSFRTDKEISYFLILNGKTVTYFKKIALS